MQGPLSRQTHLQQSQRQRHHSQRRVYISNKQASSCTECRRRKQKCSQGNPCTNCARRFPQPICSYGNDTRTSSNRAVQKALSGEALRDIPQQSPYSYLSLAGVQGAILQIENSWENEALDHEHWTLGLSCVSSQSTSHQSTSGRLLAHHVVERAYPGKLKNWLPFRLVAPNGKGNTSKKKIAGALEALVHRRMTEDDINPEDEWILDAARLIWTVQGSYQPSVAPGGLDGQMCCLPMVPTKLNKELLRTHLRLLCRFKGSVSGTPEPNNPLMLHWVSFVIQDPLLLQTCFFASACFLNETGHLPKAIVIALRMLIIQRLNENLCNESSQASDVTIHAVAEMLLLEWYWGSTQELYAHMSGLKIMIGMRGGLQGLGLHGFISKLILIHDICIAIGHETEPEIYGHAGFEFCDPIHVPFQSSLNTPLISGWPSFASCAGSLSLHPYSAIILDHMRLVHEAISASPESPGASEVEQVMDLAARVLGMVQAFPEIVFVQREPAIRVPSEGTPSDITSSTSSNNGTSPTNSNTSDSSSTSTNIVEQNLKAQATSQVISPQVSDWRRAGAPDFEYMLIRKTAMLFCEAIVARHPTSHLLTADETLHLWYVSWKMSMGRRRSLVGIHFWVQVFLAASCHGIAPARFIKTELQSSLMTIAVENWHLAIDIGEAVLKFQRWLGGSQAATQKSGRVAVGGEDAIARHKFPQKQTTDYLTTLLRGSGDDDGNGDADAII